MGEIKHDIIIRWNIQLFYLYFNINLMQFVHKKAIFVAISMIINTQNRLLEYRL
jgi:hypothetical protein